MKLFAAFIFLVFMSIFLIGAPVFLLFYATSKKRTTRQCLTYTLGVMVIAAAGSTYYYAPILATAH